MIRVGPMRGRTRERAGTRSGRVWQGVLTRRGLVLLTVGVVIVLVSLAIGQRDLVRLGLLLVLVPLVGAALAMWWHPRVRTTRRREPMTVPLGSRTEEVVGVERVGGPPGTLTEFSDSVPTVLGRAVPSAGATTTILEPSLRGRFAVGPALMITSDPFGTARHVRRRGGAAEVAVAPRIVPLAGLASLGSPSDDARPEAGAQGTNGPDDAMIRDWHTGDSVRRIHWRSSAHRGQLMVRREERTQAPSVRIVLDSRASRHVGSGPDSSFEWAVSAAASIGVHLLTTNHEIGLIDATGTVSGDLLDALIDETPCPLTGLENVAAACAGADGPVVAVLGRLDPTDVEILAELRRDRTAALAIVLDTDSFTSRRFRSTPEQADAHRAALAELADSSWRIVPANRHSDVAELWLELADELGADR